MTDASIHAASWLINPDSPPVAGGAILVRDGVVAATGTLNELKRSHSVPVFEHPDCAIIPGFINAHTHLELTHFPSWRIRSSLDYEPRSFTDWIIQLIKISRGLHMEDFRASLAEGMRKCAESGTTAVGDIVTRYDLVPVAGMPPLAGVLFLEALGHDPALFDSRLDKALAASLKLENTPTAAGLSPHSPYTISERNMSLVADVARTRGMPMAVHIAESREETGFVHDTCGPLADIFYPFVGWELFLPKPHRCTPTELLDRNGLLTPATMAVHCVHVNLSDARILKERGVSVCLCPRSNDRLDVGTAPVALFKKLAIPLALGTDSLASNDSLSMWDEMRFALDVFAKDLSPADVFRMATTGGASALGLSGATGSLTPGRRADFQVVRNVEGGEKGVMGRLIGQGRVSGVTIGGISDTAQFPG